MEGGCTLSFLSVVLNRLLQQLVRNQAYPFHIFAKTILLLNQGQFRLGEGKKKVGGGREPRADREGKVDLIISSVVNSGVCCAVPDP